MVGWTKTNVVGVSILPEKYFVERIAGEYVEVIVMVDEGYNPVTYEPKPKQLARLNNANVYFLAGVPFEKKWIRVFEKNHPRMKLVSLTREIKLRHFQRANGDVHVHDNTQHAHQLDPHFWLNPLLVKKAAKIIRDSLSELDPARKDFYYKNYQDFTGDLDKLDLQIKEKFLNAKRKQFAVFHPSWGYFADAYGLKQIAIEVQNRQTGAKTLNSTIKKIVQHNIKVIFVQKQFSSTDALMIAKETGAQVIEVNPLAENYIDNMKNVSNLIAEAL